MSTIAPMNKSPHLVWTHYLQGAHLLPQQKVKPTTDTWVEARKSELYVPSSETKHNILILQSKQ